MELDTQDFASEEGPEARWLGPVSQEEPCGENLEYDIGFLELLTSAEGIPERQFGDKVIPAEPPDWREVSKLAEELMARTRDLRIAVIWLRAELNRGNFATLGTSLRLLAKWVDLYWDGVHPRLEPDDDNDPLVRTNVLIALAQPEGILRDVLDSTVAQSPLGKVTVRDAAVALERLPAPPDSAPYSRAQLSAALADATSADPAVASSAARVAYWLARLRETLAERIGADRVPDFSPLADLVEAVEALLPRPQAGEGAATDAELSAPGTTDAARPAAQGARGGAAPLAGIDSRADAMRAIDLICDFLERTEPTNPAQLLLRRARSLINKNFLELMRELAPNSLEEVAKLMGVSPDSVGGGSDSGS